MGVGAVVYKRVRSQIDTTRPRADPRALRALCWLVTGMLLEHDVRLPRIALAMEDGPATMDGRVRKLRRMLDGSLDATGIYQALLRRALHAWREDRLFLMLDTSSVGGRVYFARVAMRHAGRAIPLAWTAYRGSSATVGFTHYVPLLEQVDALLPRRIERVLLVDRGFTHMDLMDWALEMAWRLRMRVKGVLGVAMPDGSRARIARMLRRFGALRCLDSVFVGARRVGPLGLTLAWPRYGKDRSLYVISDDPPSERTLWEYERREALETAFRDDKRVGFQLERSRVTDRHRVDQLLAGLAMAQLFLKSVGTRVLIDGDPRTVDAHGGDGLSLLELGARSVRAGVLRGRAPKVEVALWPDDDIRGRPGERAILKRFYARRGLPYGQRWIPPGSYEERNAMWWLPKGIPPRIRQDDPPVLR